MSSETIILILLAAVIIALQITAIFIVISYKNKNDLTDCIKTIEKNKRDILDALSRETSATRVELSENMERIRISTEKSLSSIRESNEKKLDDMRKTVDEKLHETLENRLTESFKSVSERLELVHKGLGEMQGLAQGVGDLKRVLSNPKSRGFFGEIQLERLLEDVFAPGQYEKNFAVKNNRERVEFALKLPNKDNKGQHVYLPIDSKFPTESYERLQNAYDAGDSAAAEAARREIAEFIRKQARDIREKYVEPPTTTDFAILFLPTEGLYAEVLRIPGLAEEIQSKWHINITGPTTLMALLNALQVGFRTLAIEKRSSEVWEILGAVKSEFVKFENALQNTHKRIQQAGDEMENLVGTRTRQIIKSLKKVEVLSDGDLTAGLLGFDESETERK